jgi:hypothetical protein
MSSPHSVNEQRTAGALSDERSLLRLENRRDGGSSALIMLSLRIEELDMERPDANALQLVHRLMKLAPPSGEALVSILAAGLH